METKKDRRPLSRCPCCGGRPPLHAGSRRSLRRWHARSIVILALGFCITFAALILYLASRPRHHYLVWVSLTGNLVVLIVLALRIPSGGQSSSEGDSAEDQSLPGQE